MHVSEYSIWMTVWCSSFLILIFYILRKKSFLIDICSVSGVIILYIFCLIRMAIPVEFSWTKVISGGEIYRIFYKAVHLKTISYVYVNDLIYLVWSFGTTIFIVRYINQYIKLQKYVDKLPNVNDERINQIISKVSKGRVPRVVRTKTVGIPCCFGVIHQSIILPEKEYTDEELYYILVHECAHLQNQDILTKALTNVLCALYWWNPIVYLLKKDLNQSLEIRCDSLVTKGISKEQRADYLSAMLSLYKDYALSNEKYDAPVMQLFENHSESMIERFEMVAGYKNKKVWMSNLITIAVAIGILVISYSFIVQAKFEAPKDEIEVDEYTHEIDQSNSYIIKKKDGSVVLHTEYEEVTIEQETCARLVNEGFQVVVE